MSVGSDCYNLTAQFTVTLESSHAGMEFFHALAHCLGVDFDSFFIFDKLFEDLIDDVTVFGIVVFVISAGEISYEIIEMSEYIEVMELLDVFMILGEVFP